MLIQVVYDQNKIMIRGDFMSFAGVGVIILNAVILILIFKSIKDYNVSQEMDRQVQILSNNDVLLQEQKKKTDDFISGIKQDIEVMKIATNNGDIEALRQIYLTVQKNIKYDTIEEKSVLSGLQGLNSNALKGLIISKNLQALDQGLNFEVGMIGTLGHIPMNEIDLCRIVGILLDNAIEAAGESERKEVNLVIGKGLGEVESTWQIKIRNAHSGKLKNFNAVMKSTKGEGRGIGMKSLNAIVARYTDVRLATDYSKDYVEVAIEFSENIA